MYGAFARTKSFTGNSIAKWDISSVTDLRYIFYDISSSFDSENIHGWNIQEVSEFDNIFSDTDLTACQKYVLYNAWSDQSSVFWSTYVVFEREEREFPSFHFFMFLSCHSNHNRAFSLFLGYAIDRHDTRKTTLE